MARRAFGPHRPMSPSAKARNVAQSIVAHAYPLDAIPWAKYGPRLAGSAQAQAEVLTVVQQMKREAAC